MNRSVHRKLPLQLTAFTLDQLPKSMALIAQKLWRNFFCQNPFPAILRRKKPTAIKPAQWKVPLRKNEFQKFILFQMNFLLCYQSKI